MIKSAFFPAVDTWGQHVFPLHNRKTDSHFEKLAAPKLLPDVLDYIENLSPQNDSQYVLVNSMAASEYFGSNINGDGFCEEGLMHRPDEWSHCPEIDRESARDWPYGFPTFYAAGVFAHHRNKDMSKSFGAVELAAWHPHMKRVELVLRFDKEKCQQFGGVGIWDKLKAGQLFDVSMGTKVPYDFCNYCGDWKLYREAQATFDPNIHKHPGIAVLQFHKKLIDTRGKGIRGLAITRKDYCEHAKNMMNRVFPDGRKVFVHNDYPRFFDISGVFIGADKTAKAMLKIAEVTDKSYFFWSRPSTQVAEDLGYTEDGTEKVAAYTLSPGQLAEDMLKKAFLGKDAKLKRAEMVKSVVPSQFAGEAVPLLTRHEKSLPTPLLRSLSKRPLEEVLSTSGSMGMVFRPREFQRLMLGRLGLEREADDFERRGVVFPRCEEQDDVPLSIKKFNPAIASLLTPFFDDRSSFGPVIEKRITIIVMGDGKEKGRPASHPSPLLHKIGSTYNGYRINLMQLIPEAIVTSPLGAPEELHKCASAPIPELFTPLSVAYVKNAFWEEVAPAKTANVERALPLRNTSARTEHSRS